ncbi:MAG: alpha/beta-type small acid-soluble spore protein [Clostridia bacterium]|nr:alpha/beta-type small acid-soluble spore protein [Clostridia bacterium]
MANQTSNQMSTQTPGAKNVLNNFKYEIANELGIGNYATVDKGSLTSRQNGYIGGTITKKLVQYAMDNMSK